MVGRSRRRSACRAACLREAGVAPADQLVVLHVSAGNPFRRWPQDSFAALDRRARRGAIRARRFMLTSGPSDADAARAIVDRVRRVSAPAGARSVRRRSSTSPNFARSSPARRCTLVATAGRCISRRRRSTPIVALFGPTLAERSMPWRDPRWFAEAIDVGPLPCRPCQQRTCEPGDFRCLTRHRARATSWPPPNGRWRRREA